MRLIPFILFAILTSCGGSGGDQSQQLVGNQESMLLPIAPTPPTMTPVDDPLTEGLVDSELEVPVPLEEDSNEVGSEVLVTIRVDPPVWFSSISESQRRYIDSRVTIGTATALLTSNTGYSNSFVTRDIPPYRVVVGWYDSSPGNFLSLIHI